MIRGVINKLAPPAVRYRINRLFPPTVLDDPDITTEKFIATPPILIYQMGKVASSTVNASLQAIHLTNPIFHVHFLSPAGIKGSVEYQLFLKNPSASSHVKLSLRLRKVMDEAGDRIQWRVITLVREPIATIVSGFFENAERHTPAVMDADGTVNTTRALACLQQRLRDFDEATSYVGGWFDRDFKAALGVDVYAHPFNQADGYTIIRQGTVSVLLMRLEDLDHSFVPGLTKFLELRQPLQMVKANVGSEKQYADEYQYVRDHLVIPEPVAAKIYASQLTQHFYGAAACRKFMDKWCRPRPTP